LRGLFESASLETQYGSFFDQRYIDYLARNFDTIDRIHWRKFEGLTAEYFTKLGWRVEIGPGHGDEGVDIRVWPPDAAEDIPPAILIQCKRQKDTIEKVVVKALYADVLHEKAESGLIVTTSRLARGAEKTCGARMYPVRQADRKQLRRWVERLRTSGTGVFLSE
jgi:restriction system protein